MVLNEKVVYFGSCTLSPTIDSSTAQCRTGWPPWCLKIPYRFFGWPHCSSAAQLRCQYRITQNLDAKWILHLAKLPYGQKPPKTYIWCTSPGDDKHRAKFGWHPSSDVGAVTKPTCETRWNLLGCPKLVNWSQPLMGRSSPLPIVHCENVELLLFNNFFPILIHALVGKIQPDKSVRWCRDGEFLAIYCVLYFQRAACSTFQTCILNLH